MKHLLLVALVATSFSGLANANNGVYASLKAGVSDTKYKNGSDYYHFHDVQGDGATLNNFNQTKSTYPAISAAVGYDFSSISPINARAELEYTYKDTTTFEPNIYSVTANNTTAIFSEDFSLFQNKLTTQSLMLNGYYDFKNQSKFTPYLSAGIGFTHVKDSAYTPNATDNHFTWSAGAGVNYAVSKNVGLDLSYRYVDAGKFNFTSDSEEIIFKSNFKLISNEYLLGIRYNF